MSGIDREQFPSDIGGEILHPGHAGDRGNIIAEWSRLHRPFEIVFDGDVQALAGCLIWHDPVHSSIGEKRHIVSVRVCLPNGRR